MTKQATCKELWAEALERRMEDMRAFAGETETPDDDGCYGGEDGPGYFHEYGLDLSWGGGNIGDIEPYVCYLLSTGGPHAEFRFYLTASQTGVECWRVAFSYQDWFDGETRELEGDDLATMRAVWNYHIADIGNWGERS